MLLLCSGVVQVKRVATRFQPTHLKKNKKRVAIRLADEKPKRDMKMSSCRSADYLTTLVLLLTVGHVTLGRHNGDVIVLFQFLF